MLLSTPFLPALLVWFPAYVSLSLQIAGFLLFSRSVSCLLQKHPPAPLHLSLSLSLSRARTYTRSGSFLTTRCLPHRPPLSHVEVVHHAQVVKTMRYYEKVPALRGPLLAAHSWLLDQVLPPSCRSSLQAVCLPVSLLSCSTATREKQAE